MLQGFSPLCITDRDKLREAAARRVGQAFRPGTQANQRSHILLFLAFTLHFGLQAFPAAAKTLLCFGEFLLRTYRAPGSVKNVLASARGFHLLRGFSTLGCDDTRLALFKRALPLTVRHTPAPAPPVTLALLERLCEKALQCGKLGLVFATFLSVLFFSVARASSLLPGTGARLDKTRCPTWGDVRAGWEGLLLQLKWGKNRQSLAEAFWIPLGALRGSRACPVSNLERLRGLWGRGNSSLPLFAWPGAGGRTGDTCFAHSAPGSTVAQALLGSAGPGGQGLYFTFFQERGGNFGFQQRSNVGGCETVGGLEERYSQLLRASARGQEQGRCALMSQLNKLWCMKFWMLVTLSPPRGSVVSRRLLCCYFKWTGLQQRLLFWIHCSSLV